VLLLDLRDKVVGDVGIEVLSSEAGVSSRGLNLKHFIIQLKESGIEGSTTEIEDKELQGREGGLEQTGTGSFPPTVEPLSLSLSLSAQGK